MKTTDNDKNKKTKEYYKKLKEENIESMQDSLDKIERVNFLPYLIYFLIGAFWILGLGALGLFLGGTTVSVIGAVIGIFITRRIIGPSKKKK